MAKRLLPTLDKSISESVLGSHSTMPGLGALFLPSLRGGSLSSCFGNTRPSARTWSALVHRLTCACRHPKHVGSSRTHQSTRTHPSSKATLWVKAQHEGALPPPCIVRRGQRVPQFSGALSATDDFCKYTTVYCSPVACYHGDLIKAASDAASP